MLPESDLKSRADAVSQILMDYYGSPDWRPALAPLDELVCTILSQNTNDRNRDVAFNRLKKAFPAWEDVRDAEPETVVDAIRPAGLANQKGARIQNVLRQITEERGELDLTFLQDMDRDSAYHWLIGFKGVGPKTASIVLQFALEKPAFPVDTHVHRVSGRLGLRPEGMNAEKAHEHLASLFDPGLYGPIHMNIIRLGREICHARKPECDHCPLSERCEYHRTQVI